MTFHSFPFALYMTKSVQVCVLLFHFITMHSVDWIYFI